jgi:hypothetical protein
MPTIKRFSKLGQRVMRSALILNHNNISHTQRLGLIFAPSANLFELTSTGQRCWNGEISFDLLFKNQMMLYQVSEQDGILYPYRAAFKILLQVETISYIEFLYSIYSLLPSPDGYGDQKNACTFVELIRKDFPNIELTNLANTVAVRQSLNAAHHAEFSQKDVWTDRTTTGNQYRYFLNHMSLFAPAVAVDLDTKRLFLKSPETVARMLETSGKMMESPNYRFDNALWISEMIE